MALESEKERLAGELKEYKVRAHALLKRRDTELSSVRDVSAVRGLEEKVKQLEGQLATALKGRAAAEAAAAEAAEAAAAAEAEAERRASEAEAVHAEVLQRFEKQAAAARASADEVREHGHDAASPLVARKMRAPAAAVWRGLVAAESSDSGGWVGVPSLTFD